MGCSCSQTHTVAILIFRTLHSILVTPDLPPSLPRASHVPCSRVISRLRRRFSAIHLSAGLSECTGCTGEGGLPSFSVWALQGLGHQQTLSFPRKIAFDLFQVYTFCLDLLQCLRPAPPATCGEGALPHGDADVTASRTRLINSVPLHACLHSLLSGSPPPPPPSRTKCLENRQGSPFRSIDLGVI